MKNLTSRRRCDYIVQFLERRFGEDSVNLGGAQLVPDLTPKTNK
jgi:hypothetical protein